jgi:hypothetical protein
MNPWGNRSSSSIWARAPSDEHMADLLRDSDEVVYSQPQVLSLFVLLEAYDQVGITVRSLSEDRLRSLCHRAVLYLYRVDDELDAAG